MSLEQKDFLINASVGSVVDEGGDKGGERVMRRKGVPGDRIYYLGRDAKERIRVVDKGIEHPHGIPKSPSRIVQCI